MKGVARAGGHQAADYEAVVTAFSRLSHAVVADNSSGGALAAAAETSAVLLQTDFAAAFLYDAVADTLELSATYMIDVPADKPPITAELVARQCVETGSPVIVANVAADHRKGHSTLARKGVSSILCVPLKTAERSLGALMIMSSTLRAFSASDIEVLGAVADQAAFAVWKSKLSSGLLQAPTGAEVSASDLEVIDLANRKIQELSVINKVSEAVMSTLDLAELLDLALDQCLTSVGANVGSIMLLDEEAGLLSIKVSKGLSSEVVRSTSIPIGNGIAGWVAEYGRPVLVHDARNDSRFQMQAYRDDITSAMSIPLKARGRVIGVLNASTTAARQFGPRDVEFLSMISGQVAMAIDNAQLYDRLDRRSTELASLLQISGAITSTLELKDVLATLAAMFTAMARVDASALLVFDADTDRFRCLDGSGLSKRDRKSTYLELAHSVAHATLATDTPLCVDVSPGSLHSNAVTEAEGFLSAVCVPLTASDRRVGAVAMFSREPRAFSSAELRTLAALGSLAGVAVHNALIYQHKYEIARSFQVQLTPKVPLTGDGLEVGHKFFPAREVGGDYYDFIKIAPGKAGIVIADVAGNSVPAAMYTSMGRHVLRAYAIEDHAPSDVLAKLNRIACDETQPEVFISVFYGVFDSESHTFRYACAGHEPPILFRPNGGFERLRADGILVGISKEADYEEKTIQFESGSILVLFTDGVVDSPAVRGKFGVEEIKEIIVMDELKPAQELADNIFTRLVETAGSRIQDDVALVVLKVM